MIIMMCRYIQSNTGTCTVISVQATMSGPTIFIELSDLWIPDYFQSALHTVTQCGNSQQMVLITVCAECRLKLEAVVIAALDVWTWTKL